MHDRQSGPDLTVKWYVRTVYFLDCGTLSCKSVFVYTAKRMCRHIMKVIHSVHLNSFQFGIFKLKIYIMSGDQFDKVT